MIDGVTEGTKSPFLHRLAEGEVGFAPVSAEFDDEAGLGSRNEIVRKGKVT
jgi:hypothetical protein